MSNTPTGYAHSVQTHPKGVPTGDETQYRRWVAKQLIQTITADTEKIQ